jgi:hypothetical protein
MANRLLLSEAMIDRIAPTVVKTRSLPAEMKKARPRTIPMKVNMSNALTSVENLFRPPNYLITTTSMSLKERL